MISAGSISGVSENALASAQIWDWTPTPRLYEVVVVGVDLSVAQAGCALAHVHEFIVVKGDPQLPGISPPR
jgi:hypothetical protein